MSMKLRGVFFGLVLCLAGLFVISQIQPVCSQSAASQKKPALYEFGAKTCAACVQMKQVIADLKASHGDKVEFRMVYIDEERDLFKQYRIMLIPTQVFLDAAGKEVERHVGALTKEEVLAKLKDLKLIN